MDRTTEGSPELLKLAVVGRSTGDSTPVSISTSGNRLEISRGGLTESFVNSESGLQHILTITGVQGGNGPVEIELDFSAAGMTVSGDAVELRSSSGRRLVYSIGETHDVSGASVAATFAVRGGRLLVTFNVEGAVYPVTVKNVLTGVADTVLQGNLSGTGFGRVVASGDLNGDGFADVATTAPFWDGGQVAEGALFVFHGGPGGVVSNGTGSISAAADLFIESNVANLVWASSIAFVGDLNGDGYGDLATGSHYWDPISPTGGSSWGAVWNGRWLERQVSPQRVCPMPTGSSHPIESGPNLVDRSGPLATSTATALQM